MVPVATLGFGTKPHTTHHYNALLLKLFTVMPLPTWNWVHHKNVKRNLLKHTWSVMLHKFKEQLANAPQDLLLILP